MFQRMARRVDPSGQMIAVFASESDLDADIGKVLLIVLADSESSHHRLEGLSHHSRRVSKELVDGQLKELGL